MVSTDDSEIAEVAQRFGAEVPFMRSAQASDDYATTADALIEVLGDYGASAKEAQDIDNEIDWELAEMKFERMAASHE